MTAERGTALFVVDRREGRTLVIVDDADREFDVPAAQLPKDCRDEGAVFRATRDAAGQADWSTAARDRAEETRRRMALEKRVAKLKREDKGGDVTL